MLSKKLKDSLQIKGIDIDTTTCPGKVIFSLSLEGLANMLNAIEPGKPTRLNELFWKKIITQTRKHDCVIKEIKLEQALWKRKPHKTAQMIRGLYAYTVGEWPYAVVSITSKSNVSTLFFRPPKYEHEIFTIYGSFDTTSGAFILNKNQYLELNFTPMQKEIFQRDECIDISSELK